MIEILNQSTGRILGFQVSGKIAHQDYQRLVPLLEKLIDEHGSIRCLVEMIELHGIEPRAFWDEIKFDVRHAGQIERCAVVGDKRWEDWMTMLSKPLFFRADIRFFDAADTGKAWEWIKEGLQVPAE